MNVQLIDGTYELYRRFFAVPSALDASGQKISAVRGVPACSVSYFHIDYYNVQLYI